LKSLKIYTLLWKSLWVQAKSLNAVNINASTLATSRYLTTFHPSIALKASSKSRKTPERIKILRHSIKESIRGNFIIFICAFGNYVLLSAAAFCLRRRQNVWNFRLIFCGDASYAHNYSRVVSHQETWCQKKAFALLDANFSEGFSRNVALIHYNR
jgi:hypothetical protein